MMSLIHNDELGANLLYFSSFRYHEMMTQVLIYILLVRSNRSSDFCPRPIPIYGIHLDVFPTNREAFFISYQKYNGFGGLDIPWPLENLQYTWAILWPQPKVLICTINFILYFSAALMCLIKFYILFIQYNRKWFGTTLPLFRLLN